MSNSKIMKNVPVNPAMGPIALNPLNGVVDIAAVIAGIIGRIIAVTLIPKILGFILTIVASISTTVAGLLFTALAAIPGSGWFVIALVVLVDFGKIVSEGVESFRDDFNEKVENYNIPVIVDPPLFPAIRPRETLTDDEVRSKIKEENIAGEVKKAVNFIFY